VVQAVDVAAQVAEGLAYAHQHQVVHRDIKPANIHDHAGRAGRKSPIFGIARMRSSETRTQTGVILGSPKYISPEQVVGKTRRPSLGHLFARDHPLRVPDRSHPFQRRRSEALMYQITNHDPAPPSSANPQVPVMLDYIIAKVLAKSPEARYQSAADFANDLRECKSQLNGSSGPPPFSQRRGRFRWPSSRAAPSGQDPEREPDEEISTAASPTKGISRAFDSQEATQRLMRQIGADGTMEFVSTKSISATSISRDRALAPASLSGAARNHDLRGNGRRRADRRDGDRAAVTATLRRRGRETVK